MFEKENTAEAALIGSKIACDTMCSRTKPYRSCGFMKFISGFKVHYFADHAKLQENCLQTQHALNLIIGCKATYRPACGTLLSKLLFSNFERYSLVLKSDTS